jgi:hypothetical protein
VAHPAAHTVARASRRGRQTRADVAPPRLEPIVSAEYPAVAEALSPSPTPGAPGIPTLAVPRIRSRPFAA